MERLPIAMRALGIAAQEAGLVEGTLEEKKRDAAIFKLMENGELLADVIMPHLGRAFGTLANANNGLTNALEHNLAPALGRTKNHLVEFQNEIFQGLKPALLFVLNNFNNISEESDGLGFWLGDFLGGKIKTVIGMFQGMIAIIKDVKKQLLDTFDLKLPSWLQTYLDFGGKIIDVANPVAAQEALVNFGADKYARFQAGMPIFGNTQREQENSKLYSGMNNAFSVAQQPPVKVEIDLKNDMLEASIYDTVNMWSGDSMGYVGDN